MEKNVQNASSDEKTYLFSQGRTEGTGNRSDATTIPVPKKYLKPRNSEGSLDFERIVNIYSISAKREIAFRHNNFSSVHSINTTRWILTIACALITGMMTVVIVSTSEKLVAWRTRTLAYWLTVSQKDNVAFSWYVFIGYCLLSLLMADAAAAMCLYWPGIPEAIGSGIPEVKAYLNGIRVKKFNSTGLFFVKMVGSVLSVGSSMAVGMEGPLVMIGAIAGENLARCGTTLSWYVLKVKSLKDRWKHGRFNCTSIVDTLAIDKDSEPILYLIWDWATSDLAIFANDAERRKLITVGAACGFAASFGAPIGGMLFIMDDISSFFDQDMFLRILVANSVGTFCLAYYRGNLREYGAIEFGSYNGDDDNNIEERFLAIPFWIIMGTGGGVLGGYFCKKFGELKKSSGKKFNTKGLRMLRISYISLINSIVMFLLSAMSWSCHVNNNETEAAAERQFFCEQGEASEMATIFFGSRGKAIIRILSDPGQFEAATLIIVGFTFFFLMLQTNTTAIPSGLFTPIVVSGASMGGAYGLLLQKFVDENFDPSAFALLGVGAMMAGIQRSTVSTCVILVEGTGQIRILLPVMIVVVIANYVAHLIYEDGVYEVLMKLKGYPYLDHSKDDCYDIFPVRDIMSTPVVTVREKERAHHLVDLLRKTSHNGFPVVDEHGRFKGLVRRKQIVALMECGVFERVDHGGDSIRKSIFQSSSSVRSSSGKHNHGLMYYAYFIKDDRFDHVVEIEETGEIEASILPNEEAVEQKKRLTSKWNNIRKVVSNDRKSLLGGDIAMPTVDVSKLNSKTLFRDDDSDAGIDGGGHDIDSHDEMNEDEGKITNYTNKNDSVINQSMNNSLPLSSSVIEAPKGFARVGRDRENNVLVISWLNPVYENDVVDMEAVMNRGTHIIAEHSPLSKAYNLFTLLGLRWIVVIGGVDSCTVVGLLTRESFLESYLKMKTGVDVRIFK